MASGEWVLATWNVNSIRARQDRVLAWLVHQGPDVLCLQELKVEDEAFPTGSFAELGYHAAVFGQPAYNGVAIVSRSEPIAVVRGFGDHPDDREARFVAAAVDGVRTCSAYAPNGGTLGSDDYAHKLAWFRRLRGWLERTADPTQLLAVCGDLNVAVDDSDVADPESWAHSVLCHPTVRERFELVRSWGLVDVVRMHHPEGGVYSWWDYQGSAVHRDDGLRLDHILATRPLAEQCTTAWVDRAEREREQPSDHAPVVARFERGGT